MSHAQVTAMFSEEDHPRSTEGSTAGQFAKKDGSSSSSKTPAKKAAPAKATPKRARGRTRREIPKGQLGFDGVSGTGYGVKGGDKRVRALQEELNRLGLTDARGRKLRVDGELGPLTTQAIRDAQRRLGMKPTGIIAPAFIDRLRATKTVPKAPARKAGSRKVSHARPDRVRAKYDPMQPRNPDGTWGDGVGGGLADAVGDFLTGQEALDASPAKLVDDGRSILSPEHEPGEIRWSSGDPGWSPQEASEHLEAVERYRGGDYSTVNKSLRGMPYRPIHPADSDLSREDFEAKVARNVELLDDVMGHSRLTDDVRVMRGTFTGRGVFGDALDGDLTGFEWTEDAFTSTTVSPQIAEDYTVSGLLLDIRVPAGTGALTLSGFTSAATGDRDEAELLLERGLRFRVIGDTGPGDPRRLEVEVVDE